jgi:hypothetical protein
MYCQVVANYENRSYFLFPLTLFHLLSEMIFFINHSYINVRFSLRVCLYFREVVE